MRLLTFLFIVMAAPVFAQKDCSTKEFIISGEVEANIIVDMKMAEAYEAVPLKDIVITNHLGEIKKTITGLKGVLLKPILEKAVIKSSSPKTLSEYYFVFTACDGYKVVYSWNELFNSATGNNIYLVTEKEGSRGDGIKEGMLTVTPTDEKTGRRFVKGLASITIKKAE